MSRANVEVVGPDGSSVWVTLKAFEHVYSAKGFTLARMAQHRDAAGFVTDATVEAVIAWVDGIPERARRALDVERRREPKPRKTLLQALEATAG